MPRLDAFKFLICFYAFCVLYIFRHGAESCAFEVYAVHRELLFSSLWRLPAQPLRPSYADHPPRRAVFRHYRRRSYCPPQPHHHPVFYGGDSAGVNCPSMSRCFNLSPLQLHKSCDYVNVLPDVMSSATRHTTPVPSQSTTRPHIRLRSPTLWPTSSYTRAADTGPAPRLPAILLVFRHRPPHICTEFSF